MNKIVLLLTILLFSGIVLASPSLEDLEQREWYNDSTANDSCVTIYSDSQSYPVLQDGTIKGVLKIENNCGVVFDDYDLVFYGESKPISLDLLVKYDNRESLSVVKESKVVNSSGLVDSIKSNPDLFVLDDSVKVGGVFKLEKGFNIS